MMLPAKYDTFARKTIVAPMPTTHTKLKIATRAMSENGICPGLSDPRSARQFLYSTEPMYTVHSNADATSRGRQSTRMRERG